MGFDPRRMAVGCAVLASALVLAPAGGAARGDAPLALGTLSGRVVAPDGRGVAGARVTAKYVVTRPDPKVVAINARTDDDGRFRTEPAEPVATLRSGLVVEADGFAIWNSGGLPAAIDPGRDVDLGTIRLDRGRVVAGQVVDADGRPRADVPIELRVYRHVRGHSVGEVGPSPRVVTDAAGRFRSPPLPVGRLALAVRVPERLTAHVGRQLAPGGEEDVGVIRLEADVPFTATVRDEAGRPVAGAIIGGTVGLEAVTDEAGKFTLRGFGPDARFQLRVTRPGMIGVEGMITVAAAGVVYAQGAGSDLGTGPERPPRPAADPAPDPVRDLVIVLRRAGLIEGLAIDAATGRPVRLARVILSSVERRPDGAVVKTRRVSRLEQPEDGRFRVPYPAPGEYHLGFMADGYHDAEAFAPPVAELAAIGGIVVRLEPRTPGSIPTVPIQIIAGTVTRDGKPVAAGWVRLWEPVKPLNAPNAALLRGRTVAEPPRERAAAPIQDGAYALTVPAAGEGWYVVAAETGRAVTPVGPIAIGPGETKAIDIACAGEGGIRGHVRGAPAGWEGGVWVVGFGRDGVQVEARVAPDGTFALAPLIPGEYGLKAGHDAYEDAETYPGSLARQRPESFKELPDPWKRATVVRVEPGRTVEGVEIRWPE